MYEKIDNLNDSSCHPVVIGDYKVFRPSVSWGDRAVERIRAAEKDTISEIYASGRRAASAAFLIMARFIWTQVVDKQNALPQRLPGGHLANSREENIQPFPAPRIRWFTF